jgi:hypothetical protein
VSVTNAVSDATTPGFPANDARISRSSEHACGAAATLAFDVQQMRHSAGLVPSGA